MRQAIADAQDPNAPKLALDTLNEIVNTYPAGAADLKARIALTFDMNAGGERKTADEMARDLATLFALSCSRWARCRRRFAELRTTELEAQPTGF